jgi:hypothetical protein
MKKTLRTFCASVVILFAFAACSPDEETNQAIEHPDGPEVSEIALREKEEGITFFSKDFTFNDGTSKATLRVATADEKVFKHLVENLDVAITPVRESDVQSSESQGEYKAFTPKGVEIMTELISMERGPGVVGFKIRQGQKDVSNGRTEALSGYEIYTSTTSNNWPSRFWIYFPGSGGGVYFQCKRKWYNGWESDTNCLGSDCYNTFDLFGSSSYNFDVDGPWRSKANLGYYHQSGTIEYYFIY